MTLPDETDVENVELGNELDPIAIVFPFELTVLQAPMPTECRKLNICANLFFSLNDELSTTPTCAPAETTIQRDSGIHENGRRFRGGGKAFHLGGLQEFSSHRRVRLHLYNV